MCSAATRARTFYSPVNFYNQSLLLWIFFLCRKIMIWELERAAFITLQLKLKMSQLVPALAEEVTN